LAAGGGRSLGYALNQWAALIRYAADGRLSIDNLAAERALRGLTIGRRNWLFRGSERGGRAAAVHFSLIASYVRNAIEPFAYLRDILTRLAIRKSSGWAALLRHFAGTLKPRFARPIKWGS